MAIKFKHAGVAFTADTPEEAARFMALLKKQEAEEDKQKALARAYDRAEREIGTNSLSSPSTVLLAFGTPWDEIKFETFLKRLGPQQNQLLALLMESRRLTDEELRSKLGIKTNQALAGVLSGLSKQAASLGVPARDVFSVQNFRTNGKRHNAYAVAEKFSEIARAMNFPRT